MLVQKLNKKIDLPRLKGESEDIIAKFGLGHADQFGFVNYGKPGDDTPVESYFDSTGSLFNHESGEFWAKETDFRNFNKEFENTYFHEIYCMFKNAGRMRLMNVPPKTCYSFHKDSNLRIHIAIDTNESSYFIFPEQSEICHIPSDGHFYIVDTLKTHSFMNGHISKSRLHLVIDDLRGCE